MKVGKQKITNFDDLAQFCMENYVFQAHCYYTYSNEKFNDSKNPMHSLTMVIYTTTEIETVHQKFDKSGLK